MDETDNAELSGVLSSSSSSPEGAGPLLLLLESNQIVMRTTAKMPITAWEVKAALRRLSRHLLRGVQLSGKAVCRTVAETGVLWTYLCKSGFPA